MKFGNQRRHKKIGGFSLLELLVAMAITLVVLGAALMLFKNSMDANNITTLRAEMQANARAAANSLTQDLNLTGIGMPWGGLGLPSGGAGAETLAATYVTPNTFFNNTLYGITPGFQAGPLTDTVIRMDAITMVYQDPILSDTTQPGWNWTVNPAKSMVSAGTSIVLTLPTAANVVAPQVPMNPAVNDVSYGLQIGDVLLISGNGQQAAGVITQLDAANGAVRFDPGDAFNINQFNLAYAGNIPTLGDAATNPRTYSNADTFTVMRIYIVTYFLQPVDVQGNPLPAPPPQGNLDGKPDYRLMRQVNAHPPTVVAEHVDYLHFTYDIADPACQNAPYVAAVPDGRNPGTTCNGGVAFDAYPQIRSVHITLAARTAKPDKNGQYYRETVNTALSPRMLSYNNTYPAN